MGRMDDVAKRKVVELRMAGLSFRKIKATLELEGIKVSAQTIYLFLRELQGRPPGRVRPVKSVPGASNVSPPDRASGSQESGSPAQNHTVDAAQTSQQGVTSPEQQIGSGDGKESDIKIVSVTSLASYLRRRVTPSPANSSVLAAGKKLLDRAQRMKSLHQATSLLRKDPSSVQSSTLRSAVPQRAKSCDMKSGLQQGGNSVSRKVTFQRPSFPQVGVRLPGQSTAPMMASGKSLIHPPSPAGQSWHERNPSAQQTAQFSHGRDSLQDQIQSLGVEVRSLGLAVKMLWEQQSRMEKEQAEQTSIQKQILKTLQLLASRSEPCSGNPPQSKRRTPPTFSQESFSFNQNSYASCSQSSFSPLDNLESVEPFSLSTPSQNSFLPGSSGDSLPLTHTPTYSGSYPQQSGQTLLPPYTQAFSTFAQSQVGSHMEMKRPDFQHSLVSTPTLVTSEPLSEDPPLSTIKVEGP